MKDQRTSGPGSCEDCAATVGNPAFGRAFLQPHVRFPAALAGEHWGTGEFTFRLAGLRCRVSGINEAQQAALRARFGFLGDVTGDHPAFTITAFRADTKDFRPGVFPEGVYTFDLDYGPTRVRLAGWDFMARLEWNPELAAGLWTPKSEDLCDLGVFENLLRVMVAYAVLERGGVLLHSAGVTDGGRVFVFFGQSGAGKSTISRLAASEGLAVLSDDLNAILVDGGPIRAEKLPFAGDFGATDGPIGPYPVAGLFRLEKGKRTALTVLPPARAVAALAACSPTVNRDPYRSPKLLENLEHIVENVAINTMIFTTEGGVRQTVEATFAGN